jgi:CheY-like chemotaxis protein
MADMKPVLLVTSRFATLDFVHNTLTAPGHDYEVRTVASAEEAILALRRSSYSLLVSEQRLPGISGAEMAQKVKKMEPKIPIVVITADAEQREQVTAAEIESVYAVEQPLTESNLVDVVRMALRSSGDPGYEARAEPEQLVLKEQAQADAGEVSQTNEALADRDREPPEIAAAAGPAGGNAVAQFPDRPSPVPDQEPATTQVEQKNDPVDAVPRPITKNSTRVSAAVRGRLELLHADTGARQVMLATMRGDVLHIVGARQANGLARMSKAVAANMAGSFDLAEILESAEPLAIHYQAGEEWELLCANVGRRFLLAILFAAGGGRGQIGTAWIYTRRAVNDLGRLLAESIPETATESPPRTEGTPKLQSAPGRGDAGEEKPAESVPVVNDNAEDLDRFWEEALAGTSPAEDTSSAIGLEEARRLGLVPPDFDLDSQ